MLIVQIVEILWTKATRGAPRSNERVALPRSFVITGHEGPYVVQRYRMAEWERFQPILRDMQTKPSVPGSEDCLRIAHGERGSFVLGLLGTPNMGRPKRRALLEILELKPGQHARLTLNARHTNYSGQHYSETIYNVACEEKMAADRFLSSPPDHEIDLKANLF